MLPVWALSSIVQPYGHRLPKRAPHWIPPPAPKTELKTGEKIKPGNLPNDAYEFWIGVIDQTAATSSCRACGYIAIHSKDRAEHKEKGCSVRLKKAHMLLQRDMKCCICDTRTTKKLWGVPLCSVACVNTFKFNWAIPFAIRDALRMVGA